jgi:type I restriction enzyme R subunit
MNEAESIDTYILPALRAAGWGADGCRIRREYRITEGRIEGYGKRGKALKADILLE